MGLALDSTSLFNIHHYVFGDDHDLGEIPNGQVRNTNKHVDCPLYHAFMSSMYKDPAQLHHEYL